jgi:hypothetical protein
MGHTTIARPFPKEEIAYLRYNMSNPNRHRIYQLLDCETEDGQILKCSSNHKWIVMRNGQRIQVEANKIELTDELIEN